MAFEHLQAACVAFIPSDSSIYRRGLVLASYLRCDAVLAVASDGGGHGS